MKITWFGHSCFKIEKDGYAIVVDPYTKGRGPGQMCIRDRLNRRRSKMDKITVNAFIHGGALSDPIELNPNIPP